MISKIANELTLEKELENFTNNEIKNINHTLNNYPVPFEYKIELSFSDISDEDFVGKAMFSEQYDIDILPVAINFHLLANEFFNYNNIKYIKDEITITLWHEISHGLIEKIESDGYEIPFDYDDEEIAEQFGQAKGDLNKSTLGKWIKNFNWEIEI